MKRNKRTHRTPAVPDKRTEGTPSVAAPAGRRGSRIALAVAALLALGAGLIYVLTDSQAMPEITTPVSAPVATPVATYVSAPACAECHAGESAAWQDSQHELAMQDKALEFEKLRGAQRMAEIGAAAETAWNTGALEALRSAVRSQGRKTGVRWADALSSSVRPVITYWFMLLYCAAKTAAFAAAVTAGAGWEMAILHVWTEADQALWAGVLNFWFMGRVFDRVRP